MTAEKFLMADPKPPIDEEEIREAVWELLFSRAPPALVRVVGKQVYHRYSDLPCTAVPSGLSLSLETPSADTMHASTSLSIRGC